MKTFNPLVSLVDVIYGSLPLGIGAVLVGVGGLVDNNPIIFTGFGGGVIVGYVFIAWKPRWMKPDWLLWLEEHYDRSTIRFMFAQVRRDRSHFKRVRSCTQEELYTWAEEMARKYQGLLTDPNTVWEQHW